MTDLRDALSEFARSTDNRQPEDIAVFIGLDPTGTATIYRRGLTQHGVRVACNPDELTPNTRVLCRRLPDGDWLLLGAVR